jgi:hypothetical protein
MKRPVRFVRAGLFLLREFRIARPTFVIARAAKEASSSELPT